MRRSKGEHPQLPLMHEPVNTKLLEELLRHERAAFFPPEELTASQSSFTANITAQGASQAQDASTAAVKRARTDNNAYALVLVFLGLASFGMAKSLKDQIKKDSTDITRETKLFGSKDATTQMSVDQKHRDQILLDAISGTELLGGIILFTGIGSSIVKLSRGKTQEDRSKRAFDYYINNMLKRGDLADFQQLEYGRALKAQLSGDSEYGRALRAITQEVAGGSIVDVMGPLKGLDHEHYGFWNIGAAAYCTRQKLLEDNRDTTMNAYDELLADILLARVLVSQHAVSTARGSGLENDSRWLEVAQVLRDHGITEGLPKASAKGQPASELAIA